MELNGSVTWGTGPVTSPDTPVHWPAATTGLDENATWFWTNGTVEQEAYKEFYDLAQFITGLICYPIICVIGLTGNVLTLIVLSHRKMLTSTNVFLSALAVADIIKLVNDVLYFLVSILLRTHPIAGNRMLGHMYPFSHYIFNQSVCVSSWLTVSVAVERYISVCHATKAKVMCTIHRARIVSVFVFVVMSLVAFPCALRYTKITEFNPEWNQTEYIIVPTKLGSNENFKTVYTWIQNLLRSVIPLLVLIVLNACIIHALRKQRVPGKKMSARNRITLMLIIVIIVFLICITPDAIMSTCFGFGYVDESYLVKGIREITDTLLSVNSAVNFIIYCLCSRGFREIFCQMFCASCRGRTDYQRVGHQRTHGQLTEKSLFEDVSKCDHPSTQETAFQKEKSLLVRTLTNASVQKNDVSTSVGNGVKTHGDSNYYDGPQTHL